MGFEQLRIVPVLMMFTGILFIYSGFTDKSPSQIIRDALGNNTDSGGQYGPNVNPTYAGVTNAGVLAYSPPTSNLTVGGY